MQATNTVKTKATTPATPATPATTVSLLATLQASAPTANSNAQLSALISTVTGAYVANANGVQVPTRGTHCINVWCAVLNYCIANNQVPNLAQVQAVVPMVHATTVSVQRAKVLKYLGITK